MMRIVGVFVLVVLAFVGTLVGSLAFNKRMNMDTVNQLLGRDTEAPVSSEVDVVGPWTKRLLAEDERLKAWESELKEKETRIGLRQAQIDEALRQVVAAQAALNQDLDEVDLAMEARIKLTAKAIENMDEDEAALTIAAFPPEDSARLLRQIEKGQQGKILDVTDQDYRVLVLQLMQEMD